MILRETPLFAAKAARQRFLPLCGICFGTHIDKCRKFTLFRYAFHKAQCAKAKSAVFAFAREYRNRARSPLFGKVASMRQIECAYRKASFSDAQLVYGKRGLSFCVTLSGAAAQAFPCHPERSGVAAQSKDLYSDFVDIFIEIPRQARDDGAHSSAALGMTGRTPRLR